MADDSFLAAVAAYLGTAGLTPAPAGVGVAEPVAGGDLPAIVLSLDAAEPTGTGIGARSAVVVGALPWQASVDLANPVLAEDPAFRLLDEARTGLVLPHGGLVRADGSEGPLAGADLQVSLGAQAFAVVPAAPGPGPAPGQVSADPAVGRLTFGAPLPNAGTLQVRYVLGQWEQRLARTAGVLRVDVCAPEAADVGALARQVTDALLRPEARASVRRLLAIGLVSLSSIAPPEQPVALRRRTARFRFTYEHEINTPESSGGVIRAIPVTAAVGAGP